MGIEPDPHRRRAAHDMLRSEHRLCRYPVPGAASSGLASANRDQDLSDLANL